MLRICLFLNPFSVPTLISPTFLPHRNVGGMREGSWMTLRKYLFCIMLLLLGAMPLFAQWDEIPELQPEQLQDNWLEQFYAEMQESQARLHANSRFRMDEDILNAFLSGLYSDEELEASSSIYLDEGAGPLAAFQLAHQGQGALREQVAIGQMRCSWALGNILWKSSGADLGFSIRRAAHPSYASLQGIAGSLGWGSLSAFILASGQKRSAILNNNRISQLYKSRKQTISGVGEEILAGGIEIEKQQARGGILGYYQSYHRAWADPRLQQSLLACSLYGAYYDDKYRLEGELSLAGKHPVLKVEALSKLQNLEQKLGFAYHQGIQLPAYAARASLLSNQGERSELSYNLQYAPGHDVAISISHALSRQNSALERQSWVQRSILALSYTPHDTSIIVQLTRLDKELLLATDSTYINSLPVHYRAQLKLAQQLSPALAWEMQFRYYYEEKLTTDNNSFYWHNSLAWKSDELKLNLGIKTWQSMRTLILPDEDQSLPEGYTVASSDDNRIFITATYKLAKIRASAEIAQSWLNGRRSLFFSLGT